MLCTLALLAVASATLATTTAAVAPQSFTQFKAAHCGKGTDYIWSGGPNVRETSIDLTQHRTTAFTFCLELGAAACAAPYASSMRVGITDNTVPTRVYTVVDDVMTLVEASVPVLPGVSWTHASDTPAEVTFFYNPAQLPNVTYFSNVTAACAGKPQ